MFKNIFWRFRLLLCGKSCNFVGLFCKPKGRDRNHLRSRKCEYRYRTFDKVNGYPNPNREENSVSLRFYLHNCKKSCNFAGRKRYYST